MSVVQRLQAWYSAECNGDWEHGFGVQIETLDNPGWGVTVDLSETILEHEAFHPIARGDSESDADWLRCAIKDSKFEGAGGASNLEEILTVFLNWAELQTGLRASE